MDESRSVVYEQDGSWHRGGINPMDVKATPTPKAQDAQAPKVPKSVGLPDMPPRQVQQKQAEGFSLAQLRKAAKKSGSAVDQTKVPEQGSEGFGKVKTVERSSDAGSAESAATPKVTEEGKVATAVEHKQKTDAPADVLAQTEQKVDEPVAAEQMENKAPSGDEPVVVSSSEAVGHTQEKKEALEFNRATSVGLASSGEETTSPETAVQEEKVVTSTPPIKAPTPTLKAPTPPKAVVPDAAPAPKAMALTDESAGFTGTGFKIVDLPAFLQEANLTSDALVKWCRKCLTASAKFPGSIFTMKNVEKLRLYNYHVERLREVYFVVGYGDNVTCIHYNPRRGTSDAVPQCISTDGERVRFTGSSDGVAPIMAIYNERLRVPKVV